MKFGQFYALTAILPILAGCAQQSISSSSSPGTSTTVGNPITQSAALAIETTLSGDRWNHLAACVTGVELIRGYGELGTNPGTFDGHAHNGTAPLTELDAQWISTEKDLILSPEVQIPAGNYEGIILQTQPNCGAPAQASGYAYNARAEIYSTSANPNRLWFFGAFHVASSGIESPSVGGEARPPAIHPNIAGFAQFLGPDLGESEISAEPPAERGDRVAKTTYKLILNLDRFRARLPADNENPSAVDAALNGTSGVMRVESVTLERITPSVSGEPPTGIRPELHSLGPARPRPR
ncbi:MAG: hypothetical protein AB7P04_08425 [Bacteriovoracia bacterium]